MSDLCIIVPAVEAQIIKLVCIMYLHLSSDVIQQCDILTNEGSDDPVQSPFKLRNSK